METIAKSFIETLQTLANTTPTQTTQAITQGYYTSITLNQSTFYFCSNDAFLKFLALAMLFEQSPSQEDLQDLCKELANLVIGKAKVLYQNTQSLLSTPIFLGKKETLPKDNLQGLHFQIQEGKCSIYKEEL